MSSVHVLAFNNTLYDLLTILEQRFPTDAFIQTQRKPLDLALRMCKSTAIARFMNEMLVHGQQVDERDEDYFMEACAVNDPAIAMGPRLWSEIDRPLRDRIWDHVQKLKKLALLYYM